MSGKGTAGIGILVAAALVVWAVANPGPESSTTVTSGTSPASTVFRVAGGAALGGQSELSKLAIEAVTPGGLDEDGLKDLLQAYLEENGIDASKDAVDALVDRYSALASQAQAFLNQTSPQEALAMFAQDTPKLDTGLLMTILDSNSPLGAALQQRVGSGRMDRINQLANLPGAATTATTGGAGGAAGISNEDAAALSGIDWSAFTKEGEGSFEDEFFKKALDAAQLGN